jgi:hypothetical protein
MEFTTVNDTLISEEAPPAPPFTLVLYDKRSIPTEIRRRILENRKLVKQKLETEIKSSSLPIEGALSKKRRKAAKAKSKKAVRSQTMTKSIIQSCQQPSEPIHPAPSTSARNSSSGSSKIDLAVDGAFAAFAAFEQEVRSRKDKPLLSARTSNSISSQNLTNLCSNQTVLRR